MDPIRNTKIYWIDQYKKEKRLKEFYQKALEKANQQIINLNYKIDILLEKIETIQK